METENISAMQTFLKLLSKISYIPVVSKKEGRVRFVTLWGFSMGRDSGRRSRSYNVAGGSPYLPDGGHTIYRRAHGRHQAATSRNVDCLLFRSVVSKECGICDHRRERWRDPSVVGVVSPRRPRNDPRSKQSFLKILRAHIERSGCKTAKPNERVNIVYHWIIHHSLSLYSSLLNTQTISPC